MLANGGIVPVIYVMAIAVAVWTRFLVKMLHLCVYWAGVHNLSDRHLPTAVRKAATQPNNQQHTKDTVGSIGGQRRNFPSGHAIW